MAMTIADYWRRLAAEAQEEAARSSAIARRRLDLPAFTRQIVCIDQEYAASQYRQARRRLEWAAHPTGRGINHD